MNGALTHIQATCFHEAGHAVMTLYAGRELLGVAVSREQPGNGVCLRRRGQRARLHAPWVGRGSAQAAWLESLEAIQADIRIALAGPLAEARALGKQLRSLGAKSDLDSALTLARRAKDLSWMLQSYGPVKPLSGQDMLNSLRRQTRAIVGRPLIWRMITILARTLEREPVLEGTRVHELIGLLGPQDELRGLRMVQVCTARGASTQGTRSIPEGMNGGLQREGYGQKCDTFHPMCNSRIDAAWMYFGAINKNQITSA